LQPSAQLVAQDAEVLLLLHLYLEELHSAAGHLAAQALLPGLLTVPVLVHALRQIGD
jgi:hypothetical protein